MMRLMTTNIWGDYFGNAVELRQDGLLRVYGAYQPDVIGFQEVTAGWYGSGLISHLSQDYYFVGTELADQTNFVPMAVKKHFKLLAKGYEPLCLGRDRTKGLTWAVLQTGKRVFAVCNVHFWWKYGEEEFDRFRMENARQLCDMMQYLHRRFSCPVFAMGDMNCVRDYPVFTEIYRENSIRHLFDLTENRDDVCTIREYPTADANGVFHGEKSEKDYTAAIDHIVAMGGGFEVLQYRVVTEQYALDATDHCPVFADFELK